MACEESRKSFHGANWMLADVGVISFAFFMLSPFISYLHKMERKSSKQNNKAKSSTKIALKIHLYFPRGGKIVLF